MTATKRGRVAKLTWERDLRSGLYFAHSKLGMWMIEQHRGKFILTLSLAGVPIGGAEQDMGSYLTSAKAKAEADRENRALSMLDSILP